MVRLVSSRVHRCYSRSGAQRSARNERLNDFAHLIACTTALLDKDISFTTFGKAVVIPASSSAIGVFLLFIVHTFDLFAAYNAHNMFYKWSREYRKKRAFMASPTNVDMLITSFYFLSSVVFYTVASSVVLKGATLQEKAQKVHVATSFLHFAGSFFNIALSLPGQEYEVPPSMSRAQNMVVALFNAGSLIKLYSALLETSDGVLGPGIQVFLGEAATAANALIWIGSAFNFVRVSKFLAKVHAWVKEEMNKNGKTHYKGLLSWFKSSRVNIETIDNDSELEDFPVDDVEEAKANK